MKWSSIFERSSETHTAAQAHCPPAPTTRTPSAKSTQGAWPTKPGYHPLWAQRNAGNAAPRGRATSKNTSQGQAALDNVGSFLLVSRQQACIGQLDALDEITRIGQREDGAPSEPCGSKGAEEAASKNRQQFIRLIDERMRLALKALDRVGNLSNKTNYHYKDNEALKIIETLNQKTSEITKKFEAGMRSKSDKEWSLFD